MSYEYKITINQNLPKDILNNIVNKISIGNIFHIFKITSDYICCIYKKEMNNSEILKWGGNFIISKKDNKLFLTVNSGNTKEIKSTIINIFEQLDINIILEDLE